MWRMSIAFLSDILSVPQGDLCGAGMLLKVSQHQFFQRRQWLSVGNGSNTREYNVEADKLSKLARADMDDTILVKDFWDGSLKEMYSLAYV